MIATPSQELKPEEPEGPSALPMLQLSQSVHILQAREQVRPLHWEGHPSSRSGPALSTPGALRQQPARCRAAWPSSKTWHAPPLRHPTPDQDRPVVAHRAHPRLRTQVFNRPNPKCFTSSMMEAHSLNAVPRAARLVKRIPNRLSMLSDPNVVNDFNMVCSSRKREFFL